MPDPVELEIFRELFHSIAEEMGASLRRSAFSPNIRERRDYSCAVFDQHAQVIAMGDHMPVHLGSMPMSVRAAIERLALGRGDMAMVNDPFAGGTHLPDITLVTPIHIDKRLKRKNPDFYVASRAHHADVGGAAAGSMCLSREIYQEGLRIPPVRLVSRGEIVDDVLQLILLNVRVPEERRGDYLAQIAGNLIGIRRLHELLRQWRLEEIEQGCDAIIRAVARRMRAGIAELPDGEYRFEDVLDDDGMGTTDIPIAVRIEVRGDEIFFDFAGSGPQVRGNMNNSYAGLQASVLFALKVLIDPDGPTNHGMLEPVHITAPRGSVVNASFPAATAARAQTCQRIIDVILGALAAAVPDRIIAASNGANGVAACWLSAAMMSRSLFAKLTKRDA